MKEGDRCPHCYNGKLEYVLADEPYSEDHYQCSVCDSTYMVELTYPGQRLKSVLKGETE